MTDILEPLNSAVAGFLGSSTVQLTERLVVLYVMVVWVATAWWVFSDASRRTTSLPAPYLVAGLVVLATPVFFLPVAILYRLIRPAETLAETTERDLTEAALEATATRLTCPSCDAAIEAGWRQCPFCRQTLLVACPKCAQPVDAGWSICPWCVKELPRAREPVGVFDEGAWPGDDGPRAWPSWGAGDDRTDAPGDRSSPPADAPIVWPADWEEGAEPRRPTRPATRL